MGDDTGVMSNYDLLPLGAGEDEFETNDPILGGTNDVDTESTHKKAQDVADATGVKYEDLAVDREGDDRDYDDYDADKVNTDIDANVGFNDNKSYINEATDTVLGQLGTMGDSAFAQQQERIAKENAGSRGLSNATLGEQAGREAWIGASFDIAKNDANTNAEFSKAQLDAEYNIETIKAEAIISGEMIEQEAKIAQSDKAVADAFESRIKGAGAQDSIMLNDLQDRYNKTTLDINNRAAQMITELNLDATRETNLLNSVREIQTDRSIFVENIVTDPAMLELGGDVINKLINDKDDMAANEIRFLGDLTGVDLDAFADEYFGGIAIDLGDGSSTTKVLPPPKPVQTQEDIINSTTNQEVKIDEGAKAPVGNTITPPEKDALNTARDTMLGLF